MADKGEGKKDARKPLLTLSTQLDACEQVEIDGEGYDILGFKHLSDEEEAQVMATLARYDNLSVKLVTTGDDKEAVQIARRMREKRLDLLTRLTTVPLEVASALPPTEQVKLLREVQRETGMSADDGDSSAG